MIVLWDLVQLVLYLFLAFVAVFLLWLRKKQKKINQLPGPPAWPLIGNLFDLMHANDEIIPRSLKFAEDYGPIFRLWAGPIGIVSLSKAEYVEEILASKEINKSFAYRFLKPWLGLGLLISSGSRWFKHRKMITPTFHFKILDSFIPVFENKSDILIRKLQKHADKNEIFDVYPYITLCALDIICETAMGMNLEAQESPDSAYVNAIYTISRLITERFSRAYLHRDIVYNNTLAGKEYNKCVKILHDFTEKVIREKKESRKTQSEESSVSDDGVKQRKAFLDLLLDAGSNLTDIDLREEVDTFMFEGHDTTTAGISWTLLLLGLHPEIQEEAVEEINAVWPQGEPLTIAILNEMKLLERIIKESLRLYPSVPFISRQLENSMVIGGYEIPSTTTVTVAIMALHRDKDVFPEPEKFDPDRFLPENVHQRHPFAYVPFSAGPRNCIGQKFAIFEEKVILASMIREYKFISVDKLEEVPILAELIQRPKNGIRLKIYKRQKN